jgi:dolichol kinase
VAAVGGLVSMLAELVPFPIDDNFSVPVLSGLGLTLIDAAHPLF